MFLLAEHRTLTQIFLILAFREGLDEIGSTNLREPEIAAFQQKDREKRPWVYI